jgi:RNA polymerase sigma factor (sigma-70 family)
MAPLSRLETVHHLSDADLVTAARLSGTSGGDAFGTLVRRYQRMVYALATSLVRPADVDDVAQEAFLRAFRNLDVLADPARFGVWLRRIVFGVSIDHVRAAASRRAISLESSPIDRDYEDWDESLDPVAADPSPLERLERNEIAQRVLAAIDRLPARYRVPLTLYHIDGLSHAKVARTLDIPEATVRSLVARARRKLTRVLAHAPEVRDMADESRSMRDAMDVLDDAPTQPPRFLHVLNGDSVRMTLERSDVPGAFAPYADTLHEGPVPRETGTEAWRETRARYIAASGYATYSEAMRISGQWDAQLASFADYDEVVLWFEHDLFDQLLLVRHLDWFSRRDLGRTALSLICIGEFPGFEPFHGLGQLDAEQLASLLGTRAHVSSDQLALGRRTWEAFTASDPSALAAIVREPTSSLRFLPGALERLLEEYPATGTGLPRTERHILELVAHAPVSTHRLFRDEQTHEERVFMGDWTFWHRLRLLAAGPTPLVTFDIDSEQEPDLPDVPVRITDAGRDVLGGRADWVRLNGFDRWLGGVHLSAPLGGDVDWRWDTPTRSLMRR